MLRAVAGDEMLRAAGGGRRARMKVLALVSPYDGASAAMLADGVISAQARIAAEHGLAATVPAMVADLIARAGNPALVAVVVGPGSFTGLRAGLSVAHGVALGCDAALVGVTVAEAVAEAAFPVLDGRTLWTAIIARRGRVFIDRDGAVAGHDVGALPAARGRIAVAGNAANEVAAILAACGTDVMLTNLRTPDPACVAAVALRRHAGGLPPCAPLPLYVDAPEARPALGIRAAPAPAPAA